MMLSLFILSFLVLTLTAKLAYEIYIDGRTTRYTLLQDSETVCNSEGFTLSNYHPTGQRERTLYTVR